MYNNITIIFPLLLITITMSSLASCNGCDELSSTNHTDKDNLPPEIVQKIKTIIENFNNEQYSELDILTIALAKEYYEGTRTKQEVMDTIGSKVWLYLNE